MQRTGRVRFVVLKARQQGLSTVISAWQYWWLSQRKAQKGLVMAHEAESTQTLFDMYKRIHENVPDIVRPSTKYSRGQNWYSTSSTRLRVATAGGRGVARGETLTVAHLSEVAFWPVRLREHQLQRPRPGHP
jgi:phage terminase large subunit-like protein